MGSTCVIPVPHHVLMVTKTRDDEYRYEVDEWLWRTRPASVERAARDQAKRRRRPVTGKPRVKVVLVWETEQGEESAA